MAIRSVALRAGTMAWLDEGDRAALLLLHDSGLDRTTWVAQVRAFAATRRVLAPDLLGEVAPKGVDEAGIESTARDVGQALDCLGAPRVVAVGLAAGGCLALSLWHADPQRCAGLVLVSYVPRPNEIAWLPTVNVPTLVVVGAADPLLGVADSERMARELPAGRSVVIPAAGHLVNVDQPGAFNAAVRDFLESVDNG